MPGTSKDLDGLMSKGPSRWSQAREGRGGGGGGGCGSGSAGLSAGPAGSTWVGGGWSSASAAPKAK
eukprot:11680201-Alexandrium_andersonii.AAC.1